MTQTSKPCKCPKCGAETLYHIIISFNAQTLWSALPTNKCECGNQLEPKDICPEKTSASDDSQATGNMPLAYKQIAAATDGKPIFSFTTRDIYSSVIHELPFTEKAREIIDRIIHLCKYDFERFGDIPDSRDFICYDNVIEWLTNNILSLPEIQQMNLSNAELNTFVRNVAHNMVCSRIRIDFSTFPNASRYND